MKLCRHLGDVYFGPARPMCVEFQHFEKYLPCAAGIGPPSGIRTPDTLLKRQVLCRLS